MVGRLAIDTTEDTDKRYRWTTLPGLWALALVGLGDSNRGDALLAVYCNPVFGLVVSVSGPAQNCTVTERVPLYTWLVWGMKGLFDWFQPLHSNTLYQALNHCGTSTYLAFGDI